MAKIFKSAGGDLVKGKELRQTHPSPNSPPIGNNIRCDKSDESPRKAGVLKRREILVASTSARVPVTQLLLRPRDQVSNLTDYHNLQNAQKLKFKYTSDVDVTSLFASSDGNGHPVEVGVSRPSALSEESRGRQLQEEVVIEGIKVNRQRSLWFDVYIRGEEKEEYYCGSFIHTPPQKKTSRGHQTRRRVASCSLRLGIGQLMEKMNAKEQTRVMVRLVPRLNMDGDSLSVESIRIDYS